MIDGLNAYILTALFWLTHAGVFTGLLSAFVVFHYNHKSVKEETTRGKIFALLTLPPVAVAIAYLAIPAVSKIGFGQMMFASWFDTAFFTIFSIIGVYSGIVLLRQGMQLFDKFKITATVRSAQERNKKTDVRSIADFLPRDKDRFDPLKYINFKKGIFLGINEQNKPIYIDSGDWETAHIMLTGRTRSGKGVATQILGAQSIMSGELFVSLDPKCDAWMPHIFKKICESVSPECRYEFLDLRQAAPPQINLFRDCSAGTIENMLIGAFGLTEKGDIADFHRTNDRKAARVLAAWLTEKPGRTIRDSLVEFGDEWEESAKGFKEMLSEMAELPAVNRADGQGIDIEKLAQNGGCLYVVGDMQNTRIVRMQRMILMRLMLLAKDRDTIKTTPPIIRVLADEFRVHISRPFIISLGASAGWRLLSILAFQSFGDLEDCPGDLSPKLVTKAVLENCAIQLSYRIKDGDTAEVLAAGTGVILVDDETKTVGRNLALSETVDGKRSLRQAERYLIDVNMITNLPVPNQKLKTIGCGVLLGVGNLAQFCFTSPVIAERTNAAITPTATPDAIAASTLSVAAAQLDVEELPAHNMFGTAPTEADIDEIVIEQKQKNLDPFDFPALPQATDQDEDYLLNQTDNDMFS